MSKNTHIPPKNIRDLSKPFWGLMALSFVGVLIFSALVMHLQNRGEIRASERLLSAVMADRFDRLSDLVLEYGYWDEAVDHLTTEVDDDWAASNFGYYLYETLGVTRAYVLDAEDATTVSMIEGEAAEEDALSNYGPGLEFLIAEARATPEDTAPIPAVGFVTRQGGASIAAVVRMTTYLTENGEEVDRSTDFVMVFVQALNESFLATLSERYMLPGLRIAETADGLWSARLPIATNSGEDRSAFHWNPSLPGLRTLPILAGGIAVIFLVMLFTAIWFIRKTAEVAADLDGARREANLASQAKSELLRNVAHEVRTPANAILGFSQIMRQEMFGPLGSEKYADYARDIGNAGQHIIDIAGELLDLARVEAGDVAIHPEEVQVEEVVDSALSYVRGQADGKGVVLTSEIPQTGLPVVRTDVRALRQILLNLLGNAVKFTPKGGRVRCLATAGPGEDWVTLRVVDNGPGIPADKLAHVLEPFGQVPSTQGENQNGTGLGLPIARKLSENLGGSFLLESEVGVGTTVTVSLPRG